MLRRTTSASAFACFSKKEVWLCGVAQRSKQADGRVFFQEEPGMAIVCEMSVMS